MGEGGTEAMKKLILSITMIFLAFAFTACGNEANTEATEANNEEFNNEIANPWIDCANLDEAAQVAGFDIVVPERIDGYPNTFIQAMEKEMIQVFYSDKDLEDETYSAILIRKGFGDDISGDYNEYTENKTADMHGVSVALSGNDGLIYKALWQQDGFAYSIGADKGIDEALVNDLVESVK